MVRWEKEAYEASKNRNQTDVEVSLLNADNIEYRLCFDLFQKDTKNNHRVSLVFIAMLTGSISVRGLTVGVLFRTS